MQTIVKVVALISLTLSTTLVAAQTPARDELKSLTYAELGKEVRALRGKVVVVYFWSFG